VNYSVYCDESCHLENDHIPVMVLGAVWCPTESLPYIKERLSEIKEAAGHQRFREIKWTKLSPGGLKLYRSLIDYFLDDADLHFRAVVIPDKGRLNHDRFGQSHDDWYYKMYFTLLNHILQPDDAYRIYLDVKDTRSAKKVKRLEEVLRNANYDFRGEVVRSVENVHSDQVSLLQLADLLIGAVGYANRGLQTSEAKAYIVGRLRQRTGYSLVKSTLPREEKFNVFVWKALD
jgi:hypothetical protein